VATIGILAALFGAVSGWLLLGRTSAALDASLDLTDDTLAALDASAGVASDTIETLAVSLRALEQTSVDLDGAFADGQALTRELADIVRGDVADSLRAVDDSLPGLIRVAGTIDTTLAALSRLPFGPTYDPQESFADSLRVLSVSLDGLPERLVEQAALIDQTAESLGSVGEGVGDLADELVGFEATLQQSADLLATYDETIGEGQALVEQSRDDLGGQLVFARFAVVLFAVAFAGLQIVPLQLAAMAEGSRPVRMGGPGGRGGPGGLARQQDVAAADVVVVAEHGETRPVDDVTLTEEIGPGG
jgi:methyl-accepting chemotaxis protein